MPNEKYIAILGCGYWGKNLIRNFADTGTLKWICDQNPDALSEQAARHPDLMPTSSYEEILADSQVRGIVIATPAVTHDELARTALESGRDVMVEKPLAVDLERGRAVAKLAADAGRILMVGHILQYHPAVIRLKQLILL